MKLSALKVNAAEIEQGAWIENIPELDDVRFKVRGLNNSDFRKLQSKLIETLPRNQKVGGRIDPAAQDRITAKCLHATVLLDWSGITDNDDKPIPYDSDLALRFLTEPEFRRIRDGVVWAANMVGEEVAAELDEAKANLSNASAGNSASEATGTITNG